MSGSFAVGDSNHVIMQSFCDVTTICSFVLYYRSVVISTSACPLVKTSLAFIFADLIIRVRIPTGFGNPDYYSHLVLMLLEKSVVRLLTVDETPHVSTDAGVAPCIRRSNVDTTKPSSCRNTAARNRFASVAIAKTSSVVTCVINNVSF